MQFKSGPVNIMVSKRNYALYHFLITDLPPPCQFLRKIFFWKKISYGKCSLNKLLHLNWGSLGPLAVHAFCVKTQLKHALAQDAKSHFAVSRKSRLKFSNSQTDFAVKFNILLKINFYSNDVPDLALVFFKLQYFMWTNKTVTIEKVFKKQTISFKPWFSIMFAF